MVQRIFERAAKGDSSRKIALDLNSDGVIPPLKYRVLYRDEFSREGAARASDVWNYTTVKRILKNPVYLGHTLLGRSKKVSVKSKKKVPVPRDDWAVTENTHPPLVTQQLYERAQQNLGRGSRDYRAYDQVRKSIFSGIAMCAKCGHSLCSCGTVYKGEREKYWYLSCTHQRQDVAEPCTGVRVRYADLLEIVRQGVEQSAEADGQAGGGVSQGCLAAAGIANDPKIIRQKREKIETPHRNHRQDRHQTLHRQCEGNLDDDRLRRMVADLEKESVGLQAELDSLIVSRSAAEIESNYANFFALAHSYTQIQELNRETLLTFVEKIEVGPKEYPDGIVKATHRNQSYRPEHSHLLQVYWRDGKCPCSGYPVAGGEGSK